MNNNRSTSPPVRTPVVLDSTGDLAAGRRGRHLLAPLALITLALAGSALRSGSEQSRPTDVAASGFGSTRLMDGLAGQAGQARQWAGTLVMGLPALAMTRTQPERSGKHEIARALAAAAIGVSGLDHRTGTVPKAVAALARPPGPRAIVAVFYALAQVGHPYRNRADGPAAFDCSGLTLAAYRAMGIPLPHRASSQAQLGITVDWRKQAVAPGDLIFTRGGRPRHNLGHVGIAISAFEWVVSPRSGETVTRQPIPFDRVQLIRRIVGA